MLTSMNICLIIGMWNLWLLPIMLMKNNVFLLNAYMVMILIFKYTMTSVRIPYKNVNILMNVLTTEYVMKMRSLIPNYLYHVSISEVFLVTELRLKHI